MSKLTPEVNIINKDSTNPTENVDEVCTTPCSKFWYTNGIGFNDYGICNNDYGNCYIPTESQEFIYNIIDWRTLRTKFEYFLTNWLKSQGVKELLDGLLPLLIENLNLTTDDNSYKLVKLVKENYDEYCNDINYVIVLSPSNFGAGGLRLFHIAFHSKEPKVTLGRTRSLYTCGYFPKEGNDNNEGSGEFHYKIDSIKIKKLIPDKKGTISKTQITNSSLPPRQQPYKQFIFQEGTPLLSHNDTPFLNDGFLLVDVKEDILNQHQVIYNNFITYWNDNINSILEKNAGGKRIRRSQKTVKKSKNIRHIVKTRKTRRTHRRHLKKFYIL